MIGLALALALQMSGGALPGPGPQRPPTLQEALQQAGNALKARGMSADGVAKVQADMRSGQAIMANIIPRLRASAMKLQSTANATPFNAAAFDAGMREQASLGDQVRHLQTDHQMKLLHSLSPADQKVYAKVLVGSIPGGAGGR